MMKVTKITKCISLLFAGGVFFVVNEASALDITAANGYLLGQVDPGSPADTGAAQTRLNSLIDGYNLDETARTWTTGSHPNVVKYILNAGSQVPSSPGASPADQPLVDAAVDLSIGDVGSPGQFGQPQGTLEFTINLGTGGLASHYEYLLVKWGNIDAFYYLGGLAQNSVIKVINDVPEITVKNNGDTQTKYNGASHYSLYNPTSQKVPEGGASVALLGLALGGIAVGRRFFTRA